MTGHLTRVPALRLHDFASRIITLCDLIILLFGGFGDLVLVIVLLTDLKESSYRVTRRPL